MKLLEPIVPWRSKRHPFVAILRADGRHLGWLAGKIGYSHQHVRNVAAGQFAASPRFRAACAALGREVGWPDVDLFDQGDASAGPRTGATRREGTAVGALSTTAPSLSTPQEAPLRPSA
jgi:hypothetical protein